MIAELKGHAVNMTSKENCLFSLRVLGESLPGSTSRNGQSIIMKNGLMLNM